MNHSVNFDECSEGFTEMLDGPKWFAKGPALERYRWVHGLWK